MIYSKTVGTAVELTGQGQVVPPNTAVLAVAIALGVLLVALVLFGIVKMRRGGTSDQQ